MMEESFIEIDMKEFVKSQNEDLNNQSPKKTNIKNYAIYFFCVVILYIVLFSIGFGLGYTKEKYTSNVTKILSINNEVIKEYSSYTISFNSTLKLANYAKYKLDPVDTDCRVKFYEDLTLDTHKVNFLKNTGYDRGHLVPKGDTSNCESTYNMANIVPQLVCFNRGIWRILENDMRSRYVGKNIIVGVEYDLNQEYISYVDENVIYDDYYDATDLVFIPKGFYRIVLDDEDNILYNIYLEHNKEICYKKYEDVADFKKLPYFMNYL